MTTPSVSRTAIKDRIVYLDSFRFLMILYVVGHHTLSVFPLDLPWRNIIYSIVAPIAVPGFFLVDGFLFSLKYSRKKNFNYKQYVIKSSKRLAIPWIFFTLFYFLLRWGFESAGYGYFDQHLILNTSFKQKLIIIYTSAHALQLYFLPSLLLIRFFSIFTKKIAEVHVALQTLFFIIFIYFINTYSITPFVSKGIDPFLASLWGFQFYLLGIILFSLKNEVFVNKYFIGAIFLLLLILSKVITFSLSEVFSQLSYLLFVYILFQIVGNQSNKIASLGRYTMGIYLLHQPLILHAIKKSITLFFLPPLWGYIIVTLATFLAAFIAYRIISKVSLGNYILGEP